MLAHVTAREVGLWIIFAVLVFIPLWRWHLRRLTTRLFEGREGDATALSEMRDTLEAVNRECRTHTFSAARVATISLHDHPICLVDGSVIVPTARGAHTEKSVFAVADRDEADWLRRYSDIFELAFAGSAWSIFWVKLPTLTRLTMRWSERRTAVRSHLR